MRAMRFLLMFFTLLVVINSINSTLSTETDEELDQLIAIDDEEGNVDQPKTLSKAQKIVVELNGDNLNNVIHANEFVMILGYVPWCPRSAELMPHFAEAASILNDLGNHILMAKLDAERYQKAASVLDIKGFPTMLLFTNGSSSPYTGGFSGSDIVAWARKRIGVPTYRASSSHEAEHILKKFSNFLVGVFEKFEGRDYQEFIKAAAADNDTQFVEVVEPLAANRLIPVMDGILPLIVMVKNVPDRYTIYEDAFAKDKILKFLEQNKFPLITKLTEINSAKVFSSPIKQQVMIFATEEDFKPLVEPLTRIARKFKSEIMVVYVDVNDENLAKPFLALLGLEDSEDITVAVFDFKNNAKYMLESQSTPSNIEDFCSGLLQNKLKPYLKSQPVPDRVESDVQVVVGKNFDDFVLQSSKNVVLEVHGQPCSGCEQIRKLVEKLERHFNGTGNLLFARIDASANEHPKLQVTEYPTLLFYGTRDKQNPTRIPTKSKFKELVAIINDRLEIESQRSKDEL